MFAAPIHLNPSVIFMEKGRRLPEWSTLHNSNRGLLGLPANIRLGWKWMAVANTLAYYCTATITAVMCFIVQAPGAGYRHGWIRVAVINTLYL
jgi:hypothetical protein